MRFAEFVLLTGFVTHMDPNKMAATVGCIKYGLEMTAASHIIKLHWRFYTLQNDLNHANTKELKILTT